jgi:peptidoglycan/xylan/chitin deacetylase (PgdA/CDA1 family)
MKKFRQDYNKLRIAALTFDDGPHAKNTPKLLDCASSAAVKLTFFVVGERVARHPHIIQRQVCEGHEIGNHSWSHPDLTTLDRIAVHSEIQKADEIITRHTGIKPRLFRPPYGHITATQQQWLSQDLGYTTIFWTVDSLDWQTRDAKAVATRILRQTCAGSIVLLHDIHEASIGAIPMVIDALLSAEYELVTASELLHRTSLHG